MEGFLFYGLTVSPDTTESTWFGICKNIFLIKILNLTILNSNKTIITVSVITFMRKIGCQVANKKDCLKIVFNNSTATARI